MKDNWITNIAVLPVKGTLALGSAIKNKVMSKGDEYKIEQTQSSNQNPSGGQQQQAASQDNVAQSEAKKAQDDKVVAQYDDMVDKLDDAANIASGLGAVAQLASGFLND